MDEADLEQLLQPMLPDAANREARDAFAGWLEEMAPLHATGSRDFGRGFAHAIRVLAAAPARCFCCHFPGDPDVIEIGGMMSCPDCGRRWQRMDETRWATGPDL